MQFRLAVRLLVSCVVASQLCSCQSALQLPVGFPVARHGPWYQTFQDSACSMQTLLQLCCWPSGGSCRPLLHAGMAECQNLTLRCTCQLEAHRGCCRAVHLTLAPNSQALPRCCACLGSAPRLLSGGPTWKGCYILFWPITAILSDHNVWPAIALVQPDQQLAQAPGDTVEPIRSCLQLTLRSVSFSRSKSSQRLCRHAIVSQGARCSKLSTTFTCGTGYGLPVNKLQLHEQSGSVMSRCQQLTLANSAAWLHTCMYFPGSSAAVESAPAASSPLSGHIAAAARQLQGSLPVSGMSGTLTAAMPAECLLGSDEQWAIAVGCCGCCKRLNKPFCSTAQQRSLSAQWAAHHAQSSPPCRPGQRAPCPPPASAGRRQPLRGCRLGSALCRCSATGRSAGAPSASCFGCTWCCRGSIAGPSRGSKSCIRGPCTICCKASSMPCRC